MKDPLARSKAGYIPTLDGWRALAIAGVMLYHGGLLFPTHARISGLQNLGASGVQLFFAISGLLICSRLLDEEEACGRISLRNFYLRRLFRIQPAAIVYLLFVAVLAAAGVIAFNSPGWITSILSVRNLYRSTNPADGAVYTAHFWSLAVEEHFYLVMPWLLVSLPGRLRLRGFTIVAGILLVANEIMMRTPIAKMVVNSEFDLCWLFLAAWLALLVRRTAVREFFRRYLLPGPVLMLLAIVAYGTIVRWKFIGHFLLPMFPFVLISTILHPEALVSRFLEWTPIRMMGRISYSLYLWQTLFCIDSAFPMAGGVLGLLQHHPQNYIAPFVPALLSYFLIEKHFLKIGHRLARPATGRGFLERTELRSR